MSIKNMRIASSMAKEISMILMLEVNDDDVKFVSINHVDLASDLSYAKVYWTTLKKEYNAVTMKSLNRASGFIRKQLASRVNIRHVPILQFIYDESVEYGNNIEKKIKEINEEEK